MLDCTLNTPIGVLHSIVFTAGIDDGKPGTISSPTTQQLNSYFNKELHEFDLNMETQGTVFQNRVWSKLKEIPYGQTITYEQLAIRLGDKKLTRAVANSNSKNPLPIVIPCHRVVGKKGDLTGYLGGIDRKRWLLKHEGALKQISLF
ncbi:MAG: methylated-DNA-[protein]-cysteine S-methyltransferase [Bacteroidia bacterium]|jgi:methylated-DNA-[protein]-cysteine S-methyltransferase